MTDSVRAIGPRSTSRRAFVLLSSVVLTLGLLTDGAAADVTSVDDRASADVGAVRGDRWSLADAPERVVLISDSAIAGIRWSNSLGSLRNSIWIDRLESCRRLVLASCRGREGYAPPTAYVELQRLPSQIGAIGPDDLLIIAVGYNDWHGSFGSDVRWVLGQARAIGFQRVGWLTYREGNSYTLPGSGDRSNYGIMNSILRSEASSGRWPELTILDYDAATRQLASWFTPDGVHVTATGAVGVAGWLSQQIRYVVNPSLAPDYWIHPSAR